MREPISADKYSQFCKKWHEGRYSGQRFGQAFFNHFDLDPGLVGRSINRIYHEKDTNAAKSLIRIMFFFT